MGASISSLRNCMSFCQPRDLDSASSIHTVYAYLTSSLMALVELKYQALDSSPFNEHPDLVVLILIAITVYGMALIVLRSNHQINSTMIWVCHICGSLACELLLLLLVSPMWCVVINLSSLLLLLTFLFYHFFVQWSPSEDGQATQVTHQTATTPNP